MGDVRITPERTGIRMGVLTAAVLIVYTIIANFAGFLDKIEAGALNLVFLSIGVVLAIIRFKRANHAHMSYFQGFGTGIVTALVASALLGVFFWVLTSISPVAQERVQALDLFGTDLGPLVAGLGIVLLGSMTGVIVSLVAMQYLKQAFHQPMTSLD
ncbi:hypothetical protein GCM10023185_23950 [Hymenobacter saemangeumensis]|uniref:DUF4199 domain-containing protein n=1 Tax=Hymenobacter saemangeumensis TaxID=1084522 RepID=A0ABP8IGJ3_9BACT